MTEGDGPIGGDPDSLTRGNPRGTSVGLDEEADLLRFSTAGSVDDGKSTLIGRLLYDSKALMADQVADAELDLARLTDGLRAAVRGWLWFMDGAVLDWLEHRDMDRARLHGLLLGTLLGAVTASGEPISL